MMRTLSSSWTFFHKFVFPTILVGGFGLSTLAMFHACEAPPKWIILSFFMVGTAYSYWAGWRLKKVDIDESSLYISNFRIAIQVPLRSIESVSGSALISPELVWITFRRPTEFGSKIVFVPEMRFFFTGLSPHPIVKELRQLVLEARIR